MDSKPSAPPVDAAQPAMGIPHTTVQGQSNVRFDQAAATFFPADLVKPVFLGATVGHGPIFMNCGRCGYNGPSLTRYEILFFAIRYVNEKCRRKKGMANVYGAILLFGIGFFLPVDDTHHFCPQCDHHVAVAKIAWGTLYREGSIIKLLFRLNWLKECWLTLNVRVGLDWGLPLCCMDIPKSCVQFWQC